MKCAIQVKLSRLALLKAAPQNTVGSRQTGPFGDSTNHCVQILATGKYKKFKHLMEMLQRIICSYISVYMQISLANNIHELLTLLFA